MAEAKKAAESKTEKKEGLVKIKLPRLGKDNPAEFVSINEKTWLIKRGEEVEVPDCVAELLRNKELMEEEAYDYDSSVQH